MSFYTQPNQYSLPTVTPPPAQPNKPTTCNQPVTNPLSHAKKQIREREPRDARSAASGEREPFRASFSAALAGSAGDSAARGVRTQQAQRREAGVGERDAGSGAGAACLAWARPRCTQHRCGGERSA